MPSLTADQCPTPVVFSGVLDISPTGAESSSGTNAPVSKGVALGDSGPNIPAKWNKNAALVDLNGRYTGCYAVATGLALSAGAGLVLNISNGHALLDGVVQPSVLATTLSPSIARAYVWLKQDGTYQVQNNTLTPPSGPCVFLGSAVTGASSITSIDDSGIVRLFNGEPERSTADSGMPTDTPPSGTRFYTKTLGGTYFWDGLKYFRIPDSPTYLNPILTAQSVIVPSGTESMYYDNLKVDGSLKIDGRLIGILGMDLNGNTIKPSSGSSGAYTRGKLVKSVAGGTDVTLTQAEYANGDIEFTGAITANINVILPLTNGGIWHIYNNTTGAFTLTVKGATGTGIVIASTKRAIVGNDGTNFVRWTADV